MEGDVHIVRDVQLVDDISIHALRVEGDEEIAQARAERAEFLSTPSGWRATVQLMEGSDELIQFLSTPSGWRATWIVLVLFDRVSISIHALRVEGDSKNGQSFHLFLRKREKNLPL